MLKWQSVLVVCVHGFGFKGSGLYVGSVIVKLFIFFFWLRIEVLIR